MTVTYLKSIVHIAGKRIVFGQDCPLETINESSQKAEIDSFISYWGPPGGKFNGGPSDAVGHH